MCRIQGGFRDVCCRRPGEHLCGEITERETEKTFSRLLHLFSTFSIRPNPLAIPCDFPRRFDPSPPPGGRGMADGGLEKMSGQG